MNLRKVKPSKPYDICVDRRSPLGNPFYMENESKRNKVCDLYEDWFIKNNSHAVLQELTMLLHTYNNYKQLRLFCWCAPKRCHAETIKQWLENNI